MRLALKWLVCFLALLLMAYLFPGRVHALGGAGGFALAALVLALVNLVLKPLLQAVCLPVTLLSAGLFFFVVNAWMVGLTDWLLPGLTIGGFWTRLLTALLVSLGNAVLIAGRSRGDV